MDYLRPRTSYLICAACYEELWVEESPHAGGVQVQRRFGATTSRLGRDLAKHKRLTRSQFVVYVLLVEELVEGIAVKAA